MLVLMVLFGSCAVCVSVQADGQSTRRPARVRDCSNERAELNAAVARRDALAVQLELAVVDGPAFSELRRSQAEERVQIVGDLEEAASRLRVACEATSKTGPLGDR